MDLALSLTLLALQWQNPHPSLGAEGLVACVGSHCDYYPGECGPGATCTALLYGPPGLQSVDAWVWYGEAVGGSDSATYGPVWVPCNCDRTELICRVDSDCDGVISAVEIGEILGLFGP